MVTAAKVVAASLVGFAMTFGVLMLIGRPDFNGGEDCEGETCLLEAVAIVSWSLLASLLLGVVSGFVAYVVLVRRRARMR